MPSLIQGAFPLGVSLVVDDDIDVVVATAAGGAASHILLESATDVLLFETSDSGTLES